MVACLVLTQCSSRSDGRSAGEGSAVLTKQVYADPTCRSQGHPVAVEGEFDSGDLWVDIGGDGSVDLFGRPGLQYYFRVATFESLDVEATWLKVTVPPSVPNRVPDASDLVLESVLGTDAWLVRTGENGFWELARSYERDGGKQPQPFRSGALPPDAEPNAELVWTTDGPHLQSATVTFDEDMSDTKSVELEAVKRSPEVPKVDSESVIDADDVPAIQLVRTTAAWAGPCRNGIGGATPAAAECAEAVIGDRTAGQWTAEQDPNSWGMPTECA